MLSSSWIAAEKLSVGSVTTVLTRSLSLDSRVYMVELGIEGAAVRLGFQDDTSSITSDGDEAGSIMYPAGTVLYVTAYKDIKNLKLIRVTSDAVVHVNYYGSS